MSELDDRLTPQVVPRKHSKRGELLHHSVVGFKQMEACYSVLHDIGNRCLRSLVGCGAIKASVALYMERPAASVGLPSSLSENDSNHPQSHAEDGSRMRFILYTEPDPSRAAYHAHTDAGLLTLALRSSAAALQVYLPGLRPAV